jgi:hypothetical protein
MEPTDGLRELKVSELRRDDFVFVLKEECGHAILAEVRNVGVNYVTFGIGNMVFFAEIAGERVTDDEGSALRMFEMPEPEEDSRSSKVH